MYVIVWEFVVKSGSEREFERAYGPNGEWARLFEKAPGFRKTDLLRDVSRANRYFTLDWWDSEEAFDAFRRVHADEYEAIDGRCAQLTESELRIGCFDAPE